MDNYPQILIEQYLKASNKLKKFDRVVFKRLVSTTNIEVLNEFARLAASFEEAAIYPYAAMCHLGVAKCEMTAGNAVNECQAYLRAARAFLLANNSAEALQLRSHRSEYKEGALRCYSRALERTADDTVLKAAIIREMAPLQPHNQDTSSFSSPVHRINELEIEAHKCLERHDFLAALQRLDDIADNIAERKLHDLYEELLRRVEVLRLLLLVVLNLPPARQSPSHIKLIEYYYQLGNFEQVSETSSSPVAHLQTWQTQYALAEIVLAWCERKNSDLKLALEQFALEFSSLNAAQRFVLNCICENIDC